MVIKKSKVILRVLVFTTVVALALLLLASLAFAQGGEARVYPNQVEAGNNTLTVEVMAENVTNMYGAEFRIKYDPSVVTVQDARPDQPGTQIEPGSLLPAEKGFVVANEVNEAEGTITYALTLLRPAVPVNGSGPLARVVFNVLQNSPSSINVEHAKLVAVDPAQPGVMPQTIASRTEAMAIGSSSAPPAEGQKESAPAPAPDVTAGGTAAGGFPWWIVAAGVLVLGSLVLGGFVVLGGMHKTQLTTPVPQPVTTRPAAAPVTSSRPSAFKTRPAGDLFREPSHPGE